jgi:hypothetical protein
MVRGMQRCLTHVCTEREPYIRGDYKRATAAGTEKSIGQRILTSSIMNKTGSLNGQG